ncbi:hypothetical protein V5N11_035422 [Cardamine amara subsp. amara]|uniref:Uncharacterized protein n=1 Tax=Cardamine amara subsp. amara TaxID=228776 RepID=A0ABD0ZE66_CARAN
MLSFACWVIPSSWEARSASFYRCQDCSLSQIHISSVSIQWNRDFLLCVRFISGGFYHWRHLRFSTDESSPNQSFGDFIWVFDPGINRLTFRLHGIDFRDNNLFLRPQSDDGDDLDAHLFEILGFMKGESMVTNRQCVWCFKRRKTKSKLTIFSEVTTPL